MEFTMKKILILSSIVAVVAVGGIAFSTQFSAQDATTSTTAETAATTQTRQITIWRDPGCGCCDAYAEYLEANGFQVTRVDDRDFDKRSVAAGVPERGLGCHLGKIDGYYVSGLVPVEIIDRLLAERPKINGITLPGMPGNAPGMAAGKTGTLKTFAFGEGGGTVYSDE